MRCPVLFCGAGCCKVITGLDGEGRRGIGASSPVVGECCGVAVRTVRRVLPINLSCVVWGLPMPRHSEPVRECALTGSVDSLVCLGGFEGLSGADAT